MVHEGKVIDIKGDKAKIEIQRGSACNHCGGCKIGDKNHHFVLNIENKIGVKVGDIVEVDMENQNIVTASLIIYLIPLFSLLIGAILGGKVAMNLNIINYKDIISALSGIMFLIFSFLGIHLLEPKFKKDLNFSPIIKKIKK